MKVKNYSIEKSIYVDLNKIYFILFCLFCMINVYSQENQESNSSKIIKPIDIIHYGCRFPIPKKNARKPLSIELTINKVEFLKKIDENKIKKLEGKWKNTTNDFLNLYPPFPRELIRKSKFINKVDIMPIFKKCTNKKEENKLDCFDHELSLLASEFIYYPLDAVKNNKEGKVWIRFIIDENGKIRQCSTLLKPKNTELEYVGKYIVSQLPSSTPAILNGKPTATKYSFSINFSLN